MRANGLFIDMCEGLPEERPCGRKLVCEFNRTRPPGVRKREKLAHEIFVFVGENAWIEPPIYFSYGSSIHIGKNLYANFNFTVVDDCMVTIGDNVLAAPNVTVTVTGHSVHHELRRLGEMFSFPVTIGDSVWISSNVVTNLDMMIGDNSVTNAESIATKDIPADIIAVGIPCQVLRTTNERDKECYYQNYKVDLLS